MYAEIEMPTYSLYSNGSVHCELGLVEKVHTRVHASPNGGASTS